MKYIYKLHTLVLLEFVTGEWKVDYWKSHHVCRRVLFLIFRRCHFQGKGKGYCKTQTFNFKLIWIDEMQIIIKSIIVQ